MRYGKANRRTNTTEPWRKPLKYNTQDCHTVCVKVWLTREQKAILDSKCAKSEMTISGWLRSQITRV